MMQARLASFKTVKKKQEKVEQESKKPVIFGIEVESAEIIVQWGIMNIYGRNVLTGRYDKMTFEDPETRWIVERELREHGVKIDFIDLSHDFS